jgi:hypothetical protein
VCSSGKSTCLTSKGRKEGGRKGGRLVTEKDCKTTLKQILYSYMLKKNSFTWQDQHLSNFLTTVIIFILMKTCPYNKLSLNHSCSTIQTSSWMLKSIQKLLSSLFCPFLKESEVRSYFKCVPESYYKCWIFIPVDWLSLCWLGVMKNIQVYFPP